MGPQKRRFICTKKLDYFKGFPTLLPYFLILNADVQHYFGSVGKLIPSNVSIILVHVDSQCAFLEGRNEGRQGVG